MTPKHEICYSTNWLGTTGRGSVGSSTTFDTFQFLHKLDEHRRKRGSGRAETDKTENSRNKRLRGLH